MRVRVHFVVAGLADASAGTQRAHPPQLPGEQMRPNRICPRRRTRGTPSRAAVRRPAARMVVRVQWARNVLPRGLHCSAEHFRSVRAAAGAGSPAVPLPGRSVWEDWALTLAAAARGLRCSNGAASHLDHQAAITQPGAGPLVTGVSLGGKDRRVRTKCGRRRAGGQPARARATGPGGGVRAGRFDPGGRPRRVSAGQELQHANCCFDAAAAGGRRQALGGRGGARRRGSEARATAAAAQAGRLGVHSSYKDRARPRAGGRFNCVDRGRRLQYQGGSGRCDGRGAALRSGHAEKPPSAWAHVAPLRAHAATQGPRARPRPRGGRRLQSRSARRGRQEEARFYGRAARPRFAQQLREGQR